MKGRAESCCPTKLHHKKLGTRLGCVLTGMIWCAPWCPLLITPWGAPLCPLLTTPWGSSRMASQGGDRNLTARPQWGTEPSTVTGINESIVLPHGILRDTNTLSTHVSVTTPPTVGVGGLQTSARQTRRRSRPRYAWGRPPGGRSRLGPRWGQRRAQIVLAVAGVNPRAWGQRRARAGSSPPSS